MTTHKAVRRRQARMTSHRGELRHTHPETVLRPLFERAKQTDEFEFCCTLLRLRGLEAPGWDALEESDALAQQLLSLVAAPVESGFRMRLLLFLYCHVTEMEDLYSIVGNLLRVCRGERYSMAPFYTSRSKAREEGRQKAPSPSAKVTQLAEWAGSVEMPEVGELFGEMLVREVRNAFYHSDYTLTRESFNIIAGESVQIENVSDRRVPYSWLLPRLNLGITTALTTLDLVGEHSRSYKSDRLVRGRLGPGETYLDVQLTTSAKYGLVGFRSPPSAEFLASLSGTEPAT